jgi:hypothetical protein
MPIEMTEEVPRPIYRHIVVKRKGFMNLAANPAKLRLAMQQMKEVEEGVRHPDDVDPSLANLIKRDHLRQTMKKVYGDGYDEEQANTAQRRQGGAIVVATLNKQMIPGGTEPLPTNATFWSRRAHADDLGGHEAFIEAANKLQEQFQRHSDLKVLNLPETMRRGVTLVTVVYSPMLAYPLEDKGFEVGMEFIQKTRFGRVDTDGFEVYSEDGTYPMKAPNDGYMMTLLKTADEVGELGGFLTDEQRQQVAQDKVDTLAKKAHGALGSAD